MKNIKFSVKFRDLFFGGTEYDEDYFYDIEKTKTALDEVIKEYNNSKCKYVYHSSW
ncbi:MAG: hypothetical protein ACRCXT_14135 [Paraclostridium sp.]